MPNTFLVAPWIEEAGIRSWYDEPELADMLRKSGLRPAAILEGVLSALDGARAADGIELGYMLSINVYERSMDLRSGQAEFISRFSCEMPGAPQS